MRIKSKLIFVAAIAIIFIGIFLPYFNNKEVTVIVTDKERIVKVNGESIDSYYLIYTDRGTFKLEDDLFYGNFNSSDVYGSIRKDSAYQIKTVGFRNGFFSMYPNIVKITPNK